MPPTTETGDRSDHAVGSAVFTQLLQSELRRVVSAQHDDLLRRLDHWLVTRLAFEADVCGGRPAAEARGVLGVERHAFSEVVPQDASTDNKLESPPGDEIEHRSSLNSNNSQTRQLDTRSQLDIRSQYEDSEMDTAVVSPRCSVNLPRRMAFSVTSSTVMKTSTINVPSQFRENLKKLVETYAFECFFSVVIIVNSIFIGAEVQYRAVNPTLDPLPFFVVMQNVCVLLFLLELCLRVLADGRKFLTSDKWSWNMFDLVLVFFGIFDMVLDILHTTADSTSGGDLNVNNVRLIRIARIARLARLLRVARLVRFVRAFSILLYSIASTFKSLIWASLLMIVVMYFFGIVFSQAAVEALHFCDGQGLSEGVSENCMKLTGAEIEDLETFWGDLPTAMFSLFKSMTGGIDWQDVVQPLSTLSDMWVMLFVFFVVFAEFALLNVITGVFCQSAIESAQHDRELMSKELLQNKALYVSKVKAQFQDMFQVLDSGGSGEVTIESFLKHTKDPVVQAYFAMLDLEAADAFSLFQLLNAEGHVVDAEEFVDGCLRLKGNARSIDLAKLRQESRNIQQRLQTLVQTVDAKMTQVVESVAETAAHVAIEEYKRRPILWHNLDLQMGLQTTAQEQGSTNLAGSPPDGERLASAKTSHLGEICRLVSADMGGTGTQARNHNNVSAIAESPANSASLGGNSASTQDFVGRGTPRADAGVPRSSCSQPEARVTLRYLTREHI